MSNYTKLAMVLGACYAAYKFGPAGVAKTAAVAIGAVVVAKQLPIVNEYI